MPFLIRVRKVGTPRAIKRINRILNKENKILNPTGKKIKEIDTAQAIFDEGLQGLKFQNILNPNNDEGK
jgi:hypothetical protein